MGDLAPVTAGLVVAAVGVILSGTFAAVLRMLVMSDAKDDRSYERLEARLDRVEATNDDLRAEAVRTSERHRTELDMKDAEIIRWHNLYTDSLGGPS